MTKLTNLGYTKDAGGVIKESAEITIVFDPGTSRKNGIFSISAGIWIRCLQSEFPKQFWNCHIYGGAEFIAPSVQDIVGKLSPTVQSDADDRIVDDAARLLAVHSADLMTISSVREAFLRGDFSKCMILKEARHFLEMPTVMSPGPG